MIKLHLRNSIFRKIYYKLLFTILQLI